MGRRRGRRRGTSRGRRGRRGRGRGGGGGEGRGGGGGGISLVSSDRPYLDKITPKFLLNLSKQRRTHQSELDHNFYVLTDG